MNAFDVILKKSIRCCIGLIVLILAASVGYCEIESWTMAKRIADGDTIILYDGRHVRYIGIDSPEIDHKNHRAEPMGNAARSMNRRLVDGWKLRLSYDREKRIAMAEPWPMCIAVTGFS